MQLVFALSCLLIISLVFTLTSFVLIKGNAGPKLLLLAADIFFVLAMLLQAFEFMKGGL